MSVITHKVPYDAGEESQLGFLGWTMLILLGVAVWFLYGVPYISSWL